MFCCVIVVEFILFKIILRVECDALINHHVNHHVVILNHVVCVIVLVVIVILSIVILSIVILSIVLFKHRVWRLYDECVVCLI